ncbi:universal stress protein [Lactobacillus sp. YT155]|uniref:universal stress protein n=1 Tax=Lactobacillus sp. YT155 TaxID=3060955 RepID=UPI00265FD452|nr:universal stress protein [Lactobacillus sp. YT155]MDO1605751.1 universal stress protein [Lactobacillus sp. YT155]
MSQDYKRILVSVDGSQEAERAFEKAVTVARLNDAHLDVLNVLNTKQFVGMYGGMLNGDVVYKISEDAQEYLTELQDRAYELGMKKEDMSLHLRFGDPKTVIASEFPKEYKNDLIMIGSTGLNAVERLLVGSVSAYVIRNAATDVIVVRTDANNK